MTEKYKIIRFYSEAYPNRRTIKTGLTLEGAKEHCSNPETSSRTCTGYKARMRTERMGQWFDGFTTED